MNEILKQFLDGNGLFYSRIKISDNIEQEEETGFLFCKNAILGHVGTQTYNGYEVGMTDQKVVHVVREEKDVFDEDSIASFDGKPITIYHPEVMVDSKNFKDYAVGHIKNVRRDGDNLVGDLVIQTQDAIDKVLSGELKDLSLGYTAKLVPLADGTLKQEDIVINHLALVEEGRAINARIVDNQTVVVGDDEISLNDGDGEATPINDGKHTTQRMTIENVKNTYDDETGEETTERDIKEIIKHTHSYEDMKQEYLDSIQKENKDIEKGELQMEKNFKYFVDELKVVQTMKKSEFRDKMYEALNAECKETLGVELPSLDEVVVKDEAIEKSVGFADNLSVKDEKEEKPLIGAYAQEERYIANLYRKFDDKETARKYSSMTYHDVIEMLERGIK